MILVNVEMRGECSLSPIILQEIFVDLKFVQQWEGINDYQIQKSQ